MRGSQAFAAFLLRGFTRDPEEITVALSIKPSKIWRSGDCLTVAGGPRMPSNGWKLTSSLAQGEALGDHVRQVISWVHPACSKLKALELDGVVYMACALYVAGTDRPPIKIAREDMRCIADLGAVLDLDLYHSLAD